MTKVHGYKIRELPSINKTHRYFFLLSGGSLELYIQECVEVRTLGVF